MLWTKLKLVDGALQKPTSYPYKQSCVAARVGIELEPEMEPTCLCTRHLFASVKHTEHVPEGF